MSNFLSQSWLMDRRYALRALGTCIALPFLECMVPLRASEQSAASPRRSAFIYLANGVHSLNYQITKPGRDFEFSRRSSRWRNIARRLRPSADSIILARWASSQLHIGMVDRRSTWSHRSNTISIDQKIAEVTAKHTRYPSMEVALTQDSLAWTADGVRLRPCGDAARYSHRCSKNPRAARTCRDEPCGAKAVCWMRTWPKCAHLNNRSERPTKADSISTLPRCAKPRFARAEPMRGSIRRCQLSRTQIANAPIAISPPTWLVTTSEPFTT